MDPYTLESGTKIKYVLSLSVYFITHRVLVVVFLSCYHSHLCHHCLIHRCMVRAPYSSPLGLYTKVSSWTTCSTELARTPSQTDAFTTVNFAKTGKKKTKNVLLTFYFMKMQLFDTFPVICRLEGDGAFTDTQGLVWTGKFNGETALGLKLQQSI